MHFNFCLHDKIVNKIFDNKNFASELLSVTKYITPVIFSPFSRGTITQE